MDIKNLKILRAKAGLSQKALADILGITQSAVTNWERGNTNPTFNKLPELAKALDCTIDELYK